jgi:hypothetical protein
MELKPLPASAIRPVIQTLAPDAPAYPLTEPDHQVTQCKPRLRPDECGQLNYRTCNLSGIICLPFATRKI